MSKCHKVIRRFSEDIDITIDTLLSQGQKKKIKQAIVDSAQELGMTIENLDETRSRRDYNRYVIAYDSVIPMASDALKAAVLLETSYTAVDGTDNGLTTDRAQELGEQFCKAHFPGHQALICTHPDGHNHSGNIHVHIVINSLRIYEVPLLPYMDRPADTREGCKHRCTNAAMEYFKSEVMEMCHRAEWTAPGAAPGPEAGGVGKLPSSAEAGAAGAGDRTCVRK